MTTSTPPITLLSDEFQTRTLKKSDRRQTFEDEVREVSQARMLLDPDDITGSRDFHFEESKIDDLNDCVGDDSERESLARYLPSKIVFEARNKYYEAMRQGLDDEGIKALEDALEQLNNRLGEGQVSWRLSKIEILLDLGRDDEARRLLKEKSFFTRTQKPTSSLLPRSKRRRSESVSTDPGTAYEKMPEPSKSEICQQNLDLALRAGEWEQVRQTRTELSRLDPSYFDIQKPMERFVKIRQLLNIGYMNEVDARDAISQRRKRQYLERALKAYNYGRYSTEGFGPPSSQPHDHEHIDISNLSISAARVCILFHELKFRDEQGQPFTPSSCNLDPQFAEPTWPEQALSFLDQGRSRALLNSIITGKEYIPKGDKKRIESVMESVRFAANAAIGIKRKDTLSIGYTPESSIASSPIDGSPNPFRPVKPLSSIPHSLPSISPLQFAMERKERRATFHEAGGKPSPPVSGLSSPDLRASVPNLQDTDVMRSLRIRMRWRRAYLYALSVIYSENNSTFTDVVSAIPDSIVKKYEELRVSIPSDAVVVEFGLPSTAPSGLVIVVADSESVKKTRWLDINVNETIAHIRALRRRMDAENKDYFESRRDAASPSSPKSTKSLNLSQELQDRSVQDLLNGLFEILVEPIKATLTSPKTKQIIFIPSGELAHVPWGMLIDKPYQVIPSLAIWHRLHEHSARSSAAKQKPNISFFANRPKDEEGILRNIPYSRIEALYLAHLHGTSPELADDYDKQSFKAHVNSLDILHLCAHSYFDDRDPLKSSVQLFKEPWAMKDWQDLGIKAEIVVFSSCLSAISQAFDSGSTFGFAHTLLATGTRAFIGSLWYVDDVATLLFMMLFYHELRRPLTPAEALHNAKCRLKEIDDESLWDLVDAIQSMFDVLGRRAREYVIAPDFWIRLLKDYKIENLRDPRCWAAFVLTGYGCKNVYPPGLASDAF